MKEDKLVTNRIAIVLIVVVVVLAVTGITACTSTSNQSDTDNSAPTYTKPTSNNAGSLTTASASVQVQQTPSPNIASPDIDYSDFIPEVEFGDLICSFVQNNEETFLYSDVSYDDVIKYAGNIKDMGYDIKNEDGSKSDDSYRAELYNSEHDVSVYLKYSQSGLSIKVYLEKDN